MAKLIYRRSVGRVTSCDRAQHGGRLDARMLDSHASHDAASLSPNFVLARIGDQQSSVPIR